ncbi:MAG: hypothetical protein ABEJ22_00205 [Haloferacaceae archaeon]
MARRRPLTPPNVPEARLDGWRRVEDATESVLDSLLFSVRVRTLVYEDERLRESLDGAVPDDFAPRFFFASRIVLDPSPPRTRMLDRMVSMRAREGFIDRLHERGFSGVRSTAERPLRVGDADGDLFRFDARLPREALTVDAVGWCAVWPDDEGYLFAGGAYPTTVRDESAADAETTAAIEASFDPDGFRRELLDLIRATG